MPQKLRFEPQDNLTGNDFSFRKNSDMAMTQANETFIAEASANRSLGSHGETMGFAKKQYGVNPEVQAIRDAAYSAAERKVTAYKQNQAVREWNADRITLEGLKGGIQYQEGRLVREQEYLDQLRQANNPDPAKIATAEQSVLEQAQLVAGMKASYEQDKARLQAKLAAGLEETPQIREYLQAEQALKAAKSLQDSTGSVAEASSVLYANNEEMRNANLGGDRQLLSRAVASYEVDKMIGLNVCAEEKFGVTPDGEVLGISIQCDGAGVRSTFGTNEYGEAQTAVLDIDYSNATVQKGLYDLQALDYITGQCDRHAGNLFVDPDTGKVTGIDNDLAFPQTDLKTVLEKDPKLGGKFITTPPKIMHEDTAAKIAAVNPDDLRRTLGAVRPPNENKGLGRQEVNGAVNRLKELQAAIASGEIQVVKEFNKETYDAAIKENTEQGHLGVQSYLGVVQNEKTQALTQIEAGLSSHRMRGPETVGKAKVNLDYVAFKEKMSGGEQQAYLQTQAEVDKLDAKLAEVRKGIEKMQNPGMKDKVAAMKHGGVEGTRRHLAAREAALTQELQPKLDALQEMTAPHVAVIQQEQAVNREAALRRYEQAKAGVGLEGGAEVQLAAPDELDVEAVAVNANEVEAPEVEAPEVEVPAVEAPAADAPAVNAPAPDQQQGFQQPNRVRDALRRNNGQALGGHRQAQAQGQNQGQEVEAPAPAPGALRANPAWQAGAKQGGQRPAAAPLAAPNRRM